MPNIEIQTEIDNSKNVFIEQYQIDDEAHKIIREKLGHDIESEDYAGLSQDLAVTDEDFENLLSIYEEDRTKWLDWIHCRVVNHWEDRIYDRLLGE